MEDSGSPQDWWTLEMYAVSLFERNKTNTDEFRALVSVFGRDKLAQIWEKYQKQKKECRSQSN